MRKITIFAVAAFFALTPLAAMPGFQSFLPDISGEYVYYKDNTFIRESYVGLLYYDAGTVQIRYYAPQDSENFLPEKDIAILITVNPDSPHWDMTGERIISAIMPGTEDMDIVNYLHDFLYEFSARRIKAGEITEKSKSIVQDYEQFGGQVTVIFDCRIPMFNIRGIEAAGKKPLECVTIGQLRDSFDKSFDDFKGFPKNQGNEKKSKSTKIKKSKAKDVKCEYANQSVTLDSDWIHPMENVWMLGDDSIVTLGIIPAFDEENAARNNFFVQRRILESAQNSYTDFSSLDIQDKNSVKITARIFQAETGKSVFSTKIISKKQDSSDFDYFSISTFEKPWTENKSYYQKIIKSYSN